MDGSGSCSADAGPILRSVQPSSSHRGSDVNLARAVEAILLHKHTRTHTQVYASVRVIYNIYAATLLCPYTVTGTKQRYL